MGFLNAIWCGMIKVINAIIDWGLETITDTLAWVIALLPSLPTLVQPVEWGAFGHAIGYFIPVSDMLTHFSLMLSLILTWYGIQHILRITRAIK